MDVPETTEAPVRGGAGRRLARQLRRPWLLIAAIALCAAAALAVPHVRAWYHLSAGRTALARYQNGAARRHLDACLLVWPDSAPARLLAARAARRAGRLGEAEAHLDECRKSAGPELSEAIAFEWALLRATAGALDSVEEALQARIEKSPADAPLVWEALAEGYRRTARVRDALGCLDTWLHFEPDNAHAAFLRGELYRQVGAVNRARDDYAHALELDPGHDDARRLLARCLVQLGHYRPAVEHLEMLCGKSPDDLALRVLLSRARHDLGEKAEAAKLLDAVLQADPEFGPALKERGRQALAAADFAAAETALQQAVRALPYDHEVYWSLSQSLQAQGKSAEAKVAVTRSQQLKDAVERINTIETRQMSLRPTDAALHAELGRLLMLIGRRDAAEGWLLSAVRLDPGQRDAHAALAELFEPSDPVRADRHRVLASKSGGAK